MPKIPQSAKAPSVPVKASSIASNSVPVKGARKPLPEPNNALPSCVACSGTGIASNKGRCFPCGGKGTVYTWICPICNARHDGFKIADCRNPKCASHRLKGK